MSAWQFFVKWAVMILLLVVIARTRTGHQLLYYAMFLVVLILVVTHSSDIQSVLQPGAGTLDGSGSSGK